MQPGPLNAESLPPGTRVGPWRIRDLRGRGAYGAVYLAERAEPEAPGDVALKLALAPRDDRFPREVGLLSRVSHPCIPRLIDQGQWLSPFGLPHPFFVMEWVEGLPLYVWAQTVCPTSRQVLGLLAGLARALEAVHALGVHRDVKGDNVLVRLEDGQGFLMDFGSSHYQGADTLTWQVFPPGTPLYRSPEAYQFSLNIRTAELKVYSPGPGDDLFALGVTAYRLVTGQYPPMRADPKDAEAHVWEPDGPGPRPARERNPACSPELSALISRMLSIRPEARGSARELAEALELASKEAGPEADVPLFFRKAPRPVDVEVASQHLRPWDMEAVPRRFLPEPPPLVEAGGAPPHSLRASQEPGGKSLSPAAPQQSRRSWLAAVSVLVLVAWVLSTSSRREEASQAQVAAQEEARDAGSVAVGDSVLTAPVESMHRPAMGPPIARDMPSKPFPGQIRPDTNGRCPRATQLPINGGCWLGLNVKPENCKDGYVYKGVCYEPAWPPPRPPTSSPTESRDGG